MLAAAVWAKPIWMSRFCGGSRHTRLPLQGAANLKVAPLPLAPSITSEFVTGRLGGLAEAASSTFCNHVNYNRLPVPGRDVRICTAPLQEASFAELAVYKIGMIGRTGVIGKTGMLGTTGRTCNTVRGMNRVTFDTHSCYFEDLGFHFGSLGNHFVDQGIHRDNSWDTFGAQSLVLSVWVGV